MYTKATKSELAQDYDSAFHLYIKAAELFLHLSRSTSATENDKSQWKKSASRALDRAERIKQMTEKSRPSPTSASQSEAATKLTPVGVDYFSPEEQSYVLKKGSNINGTVFPLWHEPGPSLWVFSNPCALFIYANIYHRQKQPRLSSLQTKFEAVWKHEVEDLLTNHHPTFPQDVSQSIVTDCSVCASISSCIEHDKRFGSNVTILHNSTSTKPQSGRSYDLKLLFNGGWRRPLYIGIDGQLPYHPTLGIPLCLTCKSSDSTQDATKKVTVSWPSIIEKGYMVLMGGYDFPGSNTAIDLHTFTGWIPEHIEIKSANFESERTWSRILWDFNNGNCMFTFGTGVKPGIQWRDRSLLSTHSYAVLDVREDKNGNGRFITVLDSWPNSESPEIALQERPNLIEIPWLEALDVFEGIYLNWDPQIWSSSLTYRAYVGVYVNNEIFSSTLYRSMWRARTDKKGSLFMIWVLLTRHVNDTRKLGEFIACKIQIEDDEARCSVVCEKQKISHKGAFTNSPHVLARMHIPPLNQSASLSILAICENCTEDTGFDVTIYAPKQVRLTWVKDIPKFPFTKTLEDTLISQNSGGNHTYPTFMINPQYHLRLYPSNQDKMSTAKRTTLIVEINKDVPIQVMICWSQGERVKEPAPKSVVATSGSYAHGLARLTEQLLPGDYSIIVSTFEPQQTGAFSLSVNSFASFDVTPIPQEGAGMYRKTVKGMWDGSSAAGAPGFNRYFQNPIYELNLPAYSQILIRLQLLCPSSSTGLNVTIYPAMADSTSKNHHVATSGPYDDPITGVATPLTSLPKGRYWVVPSTYSPGTQSGFQLIVFSTLASIEITRR
ncbi:hypothetical protein J3R30DRAFT_3284463 [Lentinula aciculospora]|uniref:Calpain catalytic domain-containing protein n=1 Tax=Lentinula aciculospora TaxID=153920 RepID=A0A9W9AM14_9AGAR|nr:hypothetical protein J3R30DRAFT_3284463 [Lentinula aciculospora]